MLALGRAGVELAGPVTDTMILSYLLESGERNHNLDQLSQRLLGHEMIPITDLIGKGKNQLRMDQVDVLAGRGVRRRGRRRHLADRGDPRPQGPGRGALGPLCRPRAAADLGPGADGADRHRGRRRAAATALGGVRRADGVDRVGDLPAGRSDVQHQLAPQLRQVLFDELKLPTLQKTPGGEQSTAQEVLEELALKHPLPALLLRHRQLAKLKGTYLDALPDLVHPEDGRIHASFNQGVAATGRLSSSDPNLQNIPVRTEEGRQIRQAFVAGRPGWRLLTADYSQIELRILAHYSDDPALKRAFDEDRDIHRAVAARIFHVEESAVDETMRRVAKTVNFGVIYGLSPFGLAARLGITQAEAAAFIDAYFQEYAGVDRFITRALEAAQAQGRVETILGRRRPIIGIKSTTGRVRNLAERTAVNTIIQGSAADLIKRAMIRIDQELRDQGLRRPDAPPDPRRAGLRGPRRGDPASRRDGPSRDDRGTRPERPPQGRPGRRPQLAGCRTHLTFGRFERREISNPKRREDETLCDNASIFELIQWTLIRRGPNNSEHPITRRGFLLAPEILAPRVSHYGVW